MGQVIYLRDGATVGERAPSLRHQAGGYRQSQSLGEIVARVLKGLTISKTDIPITKT